MHDLSYDEAKLEVDRLLLKPIQIGTMWASRGRNFGLRVVVHGIVKDKVRYSQCGMTDAQLRPDAFLDLPVVTFLDAFRLVPWD
jgi:hypothetical protein